MCFTLNPTLNPTHEQRHVHPWKELRDHPTLKVVVHIGYINRGQYGMKHGIHVVETANLLLDLIHALAVAQVSLVILDLRVKRRAAGAQLLHLLRGNDRTSSSRLLTEHLEFRQRHLLERNELLSDGLDGVAVVHALLVVDVQLVLHVILENTQPAGAQIRFDVESVLNQVLSAEAPAHDCRLGE